MVNGQDSGQHRTKQGFQCVAGALTDTNGYRMTDKAIATMITTVATNPAPSLQDKTTYRVEVVLGPRALSMYSMFGDSQKLMIPAAWQFSAPFGRDIGGVSPEVTDMPQFTLGKYDSWLTIEITDGMVGWRHLSSTGLDFTKWNENTPIASDPSIGAAIFFTTPDDGTPCDDDPKKEIMWPAAPCLSGPRNTGQPKPGLRKLVIAQLTVDNKKPSQIMQFDAQGRSVTFREHIDTAALDWEENCVDLWIGGQNHGQGTHMYTPNMWAASDGPSASGNEAGSHWLWILLLLFMLCSIVGFHFYDVKNGGPGLPSRCKAVLASLSSSSSTSQPLDSAGGNIYDKAADGTL